MHDGQHATHHVRVGGKQVSQGKWDAQHPLPDRPLRQDLVDQVCSTVCHTPCTTGGTEPTAFTTEGNKFLVMTGFTPYAQKTMLETTALQVVFKLPNNIPRQAPALFCQHVLELGPVFLDELIKQRVLWLMSLVLKRANGPEIVLEYIGWQVRVSQWGCDKQPYSSTATAESAFTV